MMEDLDKIKERIAKLLAMAKDASSPNEAAIAAGRARALMDKHQIEEFDIGQKMIDEFATLFAMEKFSDTIPTFMSTMAVAVARYNDCAARYESGFFKRSDRSVLGKRILFLGYKTDVELAVNMFGRLEDAIRRLSKEYFRETQQPYSNKICRNFELGAVGIIIERIKSMTAERQMITRDGTGTSLVIIKQAAVDEHFGATNYKSGKSSKLSDFDAFAAGRVKGATVEITPQVRG
jgi:hypothetical protein